MRSLTGAGSSKKRIWIFGSHKPNCFKLCNGGKVEGKGLIETYRAIATAEHTQSLLGCGKLVLRNHGLQHLLHHIPENVMLFLQKNYQAGTLGVKEAGSMEDGLLNKFL